MNKEIFLCKFCQGIIPWKGVSNTHQFCNNKCQGAFTRQIWMEENRLAFENGTLKSRAAIKKFIIERDGYKCSMPTIARTQW